MYIAVTGHLYNLRKRRRKQTSSFFFLPPPPQEEAMMKEMEGAAVKIDSLSAGRLVLSCCATRVPQL